MIRIHPAIAGKPGRIKALESSTGRRRGVGMIDAAQTILLTAVVVVLFVTGVVIAVDALEFEKFGECSDCVVLHKIRGWEQ